MKKCDHYRDLILTDYMDGQLDKESAEKMEAHLLDCGACRAFFKEVKNNTALPFQQAVRQPVPAELWSTIKENIEYDNQARGPFAEFADHLKALFILPRLVPVFASLVLMFLVGSVTLNNMQIQQTKDKEQGEYLVSMLTPASSTTGMDSSDPGTPIEHYFL